MSRRTQQDGDTSVSRPDLIDLAKELVERALDDGLELPPHRGIISVVVDTENSLSGWITTLDRQDAALALSKLLSGIAH